jgi:hypothetical protein
MAKGLRALLEKLLLENGYQRLEMLEILDRISYRSLRSHIFSLLSRILTAARLKNRPTAAGIEMEINELLNHMGSGLTMGGDNSSESSGGTGGSDLDEDLQAIELIVSNGHETLVIKDEPSDSFSVFGAASNKRESDSDVVILGENEVSRQKRKLRSQVKKYKKIRLASRMTDETRTVQPTTAPVEPHVTPPLQHRKRTYKKCGCNVPAKSKETLHVQTESPSSIRKKLSLSKARRTQLHVKQGMNVGASKKQSVSSKTKAAVSRPSPSVVKGTKSNRISQVIAKLPHTKTGSSRQPDGDADADPDSHPDNVSQEFLCY